ncbi:MAG: hypothetical protein WCG27_09655 [Pseudomonadota bacterium]
MMTVIKTFCWPAIFILVCLTNNSFAYSDFQKYIQKKSGMSVSCALCHVNPAGPIGNKNGQIGHLNKEEFDRLGRARAAFMPGTNVDSPILNKFGNLIIKTIGKTAVVAAISKPEELITKIDQISDLDHDGIPDAQELRDGTEVLNDSSGNPWALFLHNLKKHLIEIIIVMVSLSSIIYGFKNLLKYYENKILRDNK